MNPTKEHDVAFSAIQTELPRDRWGRPLITPPTGGKPTAYTRATTFAGTIEDTYHLGKWKQRMTLLGIKARRDLYLSLVAANPDDKRGLNDLAEKSVEAAGASVKAETGTALHALSEKVDRGEDLGYVPEEHVADLEAYRTVMAPFSILAIEGFCVMDEIEVGGTYDRILGLDGTEGIRFPDNPDGTPGEIASGNFIGDLKTGGSIELGAGKIAQQLGIYSRSVNYDHRDGTRSPLPNVHQKWGIVIHLPSGSGTATLHWFDIEAGWEAAYALSGPVRKFRARKDLVIPFAGKPVRASTRPAVPIVQQIAEAETLEEIGAIYAKNRTKWTPGIREAARARKEAIEAAGN